MQDFEPFIPELLGALSGPQTLVCAVRINLPATFQFSPATSKSIDIPAHTFVNIYKILNGTILHILLSYICSHLHISV